MSQGRGQREGMCRGAARVEEWTVRVSPWVTAFEVWPWIVLGRAKVGTGLLWEGVRVACVVRRQRQHQKCQRRMIMWHPAEGKRVDDGASPWIGSQST